MTAVSTLLWFRQDLRLADNPALQAALRRSGPLLLLYVLDEAPAGTPGGGASPGAASRWWLHHSLRALAAGIAERGGHLLLLRGRPDEILPDLVRRHAIAAVHWNRCYEPHAVELDKRVEAALKRVGAEAHVAKAGLLLEPWEIATAAGQPFKVFTPFWRALRERCGDPAPLPAPTALPAPVALPGTPGLDGDRLEDWGLLPTAPDWSAGLAAAWTPGEAGAQARLQAFLEQGLGRYAEDRDRPDRAGTSRLSPHLHHGEIGPRQVWHATRRAVARGAVPPEQADKFLSELAWREFSHHLLFHFPALPERNWRPDFDALPWRRDEAALRAWTRGRTGYPLVDAGLRELWATGWMHNRVRMVAASFLVKHLLLDWRLGAAWFWDTLVDADLANNAASWQWVAGSGADAAPYFRVFNPVLQGERFDPAGDYVRRWVPELAGLPAATIHRPWEAAPEVLARAGVTLGRSYPQRLVEHQAARRRALAAFDAVKRARD